MMKMIQQTNRPIVSTLPEKTEATESQARNFERGSEVGKLFISNLPVHTDSDVLKADLEYHFMKCGRIKEMSFKMGFPSNSYRYAFVTMDTKEAAEKVIDKFNNYVLYGKPMIVTKQKEHDNRGRKYFTSVRPAVNRQASTSNSRSKHQNEKTIKREPYHMKQSPNDNKEEKIHKKHHKKSRYISPQSDQEAKRERSRDRQQSKKKKKHRKRVDSSQSSDRSVQKKSHKKKHKYSRRSESSESEQEHRRKNKKHHKHHRK